jgi:hypothetical protein
MQFLHSGGDKHDVKSSIIKKTGAVKKNCPFANHRRLKRDAELDLL